MTSTGLDTLRRLKQEVYAKELSIEEMEELVVQGHAILMGRSGIQHRSVFLLDSVVVYEGSIDFGDRRPCFYKAGSSRASELRDQFNTRVEV